MSFSLFFQNEPPSWCWGTTGVFKWPHITSFLPFIHHVTIYGVQRLLGHCRWSFGKGRLLKQMFSRAPDPLCDFLTLVILCTCVVFWLELLFRHNQIHLFWSHALLESYREEKKTKQKKQVAFISVEHVQQDLVGVLLFWIYFYYFISHFIYFCT